MGQFLPFTVETFDRANSGRVLGEFRRFKAAKATARRALHSPRVSLAVVKNREGILVYAVDASKEWEVSDVPA